MPRAKYVPSKRDLSKAWTVKKGGGTKRDICRRLSITMSQYELNTQTFNFHFKREKNRAKFTKDAKAPAKDSYKKKPNYSNGECKLNIENVDLDVLRSYVVCGYNREEIAGLFGVTRGTFDAFAKKHEEIQHILKHTDKEIISRIMKNGLLKLCEEHELPDLIHASYMGDITTKDIKKKFNPHLGAIKYVLANKLGWSSEPSAKSSNNKGAILKMLDELNNGDTEEDKKEEKK